jgi:hypothetical protein
MSSALFTASVGVCDAIILPLFNGSGVLNLPPLSVPAALAGVVTTVNFIDLGFNEGAAFILTTGPVVLLANS